MAVKKKNIHANHRKRLRERYEREGSLSLETHELLELFLFDVIPRSNTNPIAHMLLDRFGSLHGVFRASYEELVKIHGVGDKTAKYIIDSYEEYCADIMQKFRDSPLDDYSRVMNFLIWYKNFASKSENDNMTFLLLDDHHYLLDVFENEKIQADDIKHRMEKAGAVRLLIGIFKGSEEVSLDELTLEGIENVEVIFVPCFS